MIKTFRRVIPIIDTKLVYVLYSTDDEIENWIESQVFTLKHDITLSQGLTIKFDNIIYMLIDVGYITSSKQNISSTILHEANHVCQYTFDICGFKLYDSTGRELHSYLLQWVVDETEKVLTKHKKL